MDAGTKGLKASSKPQITDPDSPNEHRNSAPTPTHSRYQCHNSQHTTPEHTRRNIRPSHIWALNYSRSSSPNPASAGPLPRALPQRHGTSHPRPPPPRHIPCVSGRHIAGSPPGCGRVPWGSQCSLKCTARRACPHCPCSPERTQGPPWPFPVRGKT